MRALIQVRCRFAPLGARATFDHRVKIMIDLDAKTLRAHRPGKARRHMEGFERNDAAALGLDPVDRRVAGILGHWKEPDLISPQQ